MGNNQNFDSYSYQGLWYEVGKYPNDLEKDCEYSTAEYHLRNGRLEVSYKCFSGGKVRVEKGKFYQTNNPNNFIIEFNRQLNPKVSYNVLWTDYKNWSLVGSDSPDYYWILSREPTIDLDDILFLHEKTRELGYDPKKVVMSDLF